MEQASSVVIAMKRHGDPKAIFKEKANSSRLRWGGGGGSTEVGASQPPDTRRNHSSQASATDAGSPLPLSAGSGGGGGESSSHMDGLTSQKEQEERTVRILLDSGGNSRGKFTSINTGSILRYEAVIVV